MELLIFLIVFGGIIFLIASKRSHYKTTIDNLALQLSMALRVFNDNGRSELPDKFFEDHYMLGFIYAYIYHSLTFEIPNISNETKSEILIAVTERLFPVRWQEVMLTMNVLFRAPDDQFRLGDEHGSNVVGVARSNLKPEFMTLPEIQAALKQAKAASLDGSSTYEGAASVLMANYMFSHRNKNYPG